MCELFALCGRYPTDVTLSMGEFSRHGGLTGTHRDGWGIAWFEDGAVHLHRGTEAAGSSADLARSSVSLSSTLVLSHIRKATTGVVHLRNTQPFQEKALGRYYLFAHNGHVPELAARLPLATDHFLPAGDTDSEYAFCLLMERIRARAEERGIARAVPLPVDDLLEVMAEFCTAVTPFGPFNFLFSDGETLIVHGHKRTQQPDGKIRPPGLWRLSRHCRTGKESLQTGGLDVRNSHSRQDVVLIASVPLTDEPWQPLPAGAILALRDGEVIREVVVPAG